MAGDIVTDLPLWDAFAGAARERHLDPARLLTDHMRECLDTWGDQDLDEEIRREVQQSGVPEEDAVELVRQHGRGKSSRGGACGRDEP